jgi:hypothetical protein
VARDADHESPKTRIMPLVSTFRRNKCAISVGITVRFPSESVSALPRNQCRRSVGIGGRFASESAQEHSRLLYAVRTRFLIRVT